MAVCSVRNRDVGVTRLKQNLTLRELYKATKKEADLSLRRAREREIITARLSVLYHDESVKGYSVQNRITPRSKQTRNRIQTTNLTTDDTAESRCNTSMSSTSSCSRAQKPVVKEMKALVSSMGLCIHCCEVLGPHLCHECSKQNERLNVDTKTKRPFANLLLSEDTLTSSVLAKRVLPEFTNRQIQKKFSQGEIANASFRGKLEKQQFLRELSKFEGNRNGMLGEAGRKSLAPDGAAWNFFSNIKDLHVKMNTGRLPKPSDRLSTRPLGKPRRARLNEHLVFMEGDQTEYFEPPLLPKVRQNTPSSFFAGSNKPYKLPERLPDPVIAKEEWDRLEREAASISLNVDDEVIAEYYSVRMK